MSIALGYFKTVRLINIPYPRNVVLRLLLQMSFQSPFARCKRIPGPSFALQPNPVYRLRKPNWLEMLERLVNKVSHITTKAQGSPLFHQRRTMSHGRTGSVVRNVSFTST